MLKVHKLTLPCVVKTSKGGDLAETLFLRALILQAIRPCKNSGLAM